MIRTILSIVISLLPFCGLSQDITTTSLLWDVARMDNRTTGTFDDRGGAIKSYTTDRIEWYDHHGVLKQTFTIHEVNGSWPAVASNGFILYECESQGNPCTITFQRTATMLLITIAILKDNELPMIYEFTIQNLTTL